MTIQAIPVPRSSERPGFLKALSAAFASWKLQRRRRADTALLMSMEPHLLNDIGVSVVHTPYDGGSVLSFHPATLATTMNPGRTAR